MRPGGARELQRQLRMQDSEEPAAKKWKPTLTLTPAPPSGIKLTPAPPSTVKLTPAPGVLHLRSRAEVEEEQAMQDAVQEAAAKHPVGSALYTKLGARPHVLSPYGSVKQRGALPHYQNPYQWTGEDDSAAYYLEDEIGETNRIAPLSEAKMAVKGVFCESSEAQRVLRGKTPKQTGWSTGSWSSWNRQGSSWR